MYEIIETGQVLKVEEINGCVIKSHFDMVYHIVLEYVGGQVKATVCDYQDSLQGTFTDVITFDYDGSQVTSTPVNGVATIDFTSTVPGDHVVKTVNPNVRNGEVSIRV